jgi:hypothetical protein
VVILRDTDRFIFSFINQTNKRCYISEESFLKTCEIYQKLGRLVN